MTSYTFSVPCLMGVEALVADELSFNGFADVRAENGRVLFAGGMDEAARANILLRCGERVLLRVGAFQARTFEQLFEGTKALDWPAFITRGEAFPVRGHSIRSGLFSVPDCQRIIKKAVAEKLKARDGGDWLDETGSKVQIQFLILDDMVELSLDTSGAPLYKRGYKLESPEATLRETLAASMVKLARYRGREALTDPFCGAGTIAIEAAMAALHIAPGARRTFDAETWRLTGARVFDDQREAALAREKRETLPITAFDIAPEAVALAEENARRAGVRDWIDIRRGDACAAGYAQQGVLMANPPYGVRLLDTQRAQEIYARFGAALSGTPELKKYILCADTAFEAHFGQPCKKKRKLYNGMLKCELFMYY